jgi:hypothetical protein
MPKPARSLLLTDQLQALRRGVPEQLALPALKEQTRTARAIVPRSHTLAHVTQVNDRMSFGFEWCVVLFTLGSDVRGRLLLSHDRVQLDQSVKGARQQAAHTDDVGLHNVGMSILSDSHPSDVPVLFGALLTRGWCFKFVLS